MIDRITRLRRNIQQDAGERPLVFLDTGAIIDFEKEVKLWKLKNPSYNSARWYVDLSQGLPFYVSEGTMRETERHNKNNFINNHPEISQETMERITKYHENYCRFLKEISKNPKDFEKVRWDTYWACRLTFPEHCKKGSLDKASCEDREIAETAIWARYSLDSERNPITSSVILSPDAHIIEMIKTMTDRNAELTERIGTFGYDGIKVVTSRY